MGPRIALTVLFAFLMSVLAQEDILFQTLDLAELAFDDQYVGCKRNMERKLTENNVFNMEMKQNKRLKRAWKEAEQEWMKRKNNLKAQLPQTFDDDHAIALMTYTSFINEDFNKALKVAGKSYSSYMNDFGFKWLHFYVTSALQLLSQTQLRGQFTVYRGIDRFIEVPPNGTNYVKFGHFLSTTLDEEEAELMGNESSLIIDNYPGVGIENFSQYPGEQEVLVPGYELFTLSPMEENDRFKLKTTGKFCSNYNCAYITGETSKLSVQECLTAAGTRLLSPPGAASLLLFILTADALY